MSRYATPTAIEIAADRVAAKSQSTFGAVW